MKKILKVSVVAGGLLTAGLIVYELQTGKPSDVEHKSASASAAIRLVLDDKLTQRDESPEVKQPTPAGNDEARQQPRAQEEQPEQSAGEIAATAGEKDPEQLLQEFVASGDPQGIRRVFAERRQARAELVKAAMDNQQIDSQWSDEITARFEFARNLVPELAGLTLTRADCRKSICALHISFAENGYEKYQPYLQQVGIVLGSDAWVHHDALPDGGVVYVAKDDVQLPVLKQL